MILRALSVLKAQAIDNKTILNRLNIFNNIKNSYLKRVSYKYQQIIRQNLQSIAYLRKSVREKEQVRALNLLESNSNTSLFNFEAIFGTIAI